VQARIRLGPQASAVKDQSILAVDQLSRALWAGDSVIIGATLPQERFLTCVAQTSVDELRDTLHAIEDVTVIILEPKKFPEMREAFHAHKTQLAFSVPVRLRILNCYYHVLLTSSAVSRPKARMKITLS